MQRIPPLNGFLEFASELATRAGSLTLRYFQSARLKVDYKNDATPVTEADRAAEQLIRQGIAQQFPEHAIVGEEFGERPGHPGDSTRPRFRWIIDPIDGTKSFVRGVPLYGVMIALEVDDVAALGVLHFPALNETVAAARGCGCHFNGSRCRVSSIDQIGQALLCSSAIPGLGDADTGVSGRDADVTGRPRSPSTCDGAGRGEGDAGVDALTCGRRAKQRGFDALLRSVKLFRTWGDCYGYAMVATGRADIMLDPRLAVWDAAPLLPIITEAGGRFTSTGGEATIHGGSGLGTNGKLHDDVLAMINS